MLNTYIETGFKYGIITYPESCNKELRKAISSLSEKNYVNLPRKDELEKTIIVDENCILDFDYVSGLRLDELKDYKELLSENKYINFVMYDSIEVHRPNHALNNGRFEPEKKAIIRYLCSLDTERYGDTKINNAVANTLINHNLLDKTIEEKNKNNKRALCFLEKYVYGDKERTYDAAYHKIKR